MSRLPSHHFVFCAVAALAVAAAGCQLKSTSVPPNFITADSKAFVLHNVDRYDDQQGQTIDSVIIVVKATYTNVDNISETIAPGKFVLLDPNLQTTYFGISGGSVYIPAMPNATLSPGKSTDVALGFRVPTSMTQARLAYNP